MRSAKALRIAPSTLSADFSRLGDEVRALNEACADRIHVDGVDGRFVPNLTIGPLVASAVRRSTAKVVDRHLRIVAPERYVGDFIKAGADVVSVHVEACTHLERTLQVIREAGVRGHPTPPPSWAAGPHRRAPHPPRGSASPRTRGACPAWALIGPMGVAPSSPVVGRAASVSSGSASDSRAGHREDDRAR